MNGQGQRIKQLLNKGLHVQNILFHIAATVKIVLCRLYTFGLFQIIERLLCMVMKHLPYLLDDPRILLREHTSK